ncbi:MAG: alpha/beta hydrolase, partial [Bacteroidales bacterium]|nr:alpha/beta hydrolase [Bacteroidales bacterium]
QAAYDLPVDSFFIKNTKIKMIMTKLAAEYSGTINAAKNEISGEFKQTGQSFPLNLKKGKVKTENKKRCQEPEKPYPYISEDITFKNKKANITLAGTLTLPNKKDKFPAVILISGSGAQNRDEELLGHKPFLIISDYLTRKGIAVLRFDDRGTAKSTGNFKSATTEDFAGDVDAAFNYLSTRKEIQKNNIGLIGHSEGGLIAPMLAAENKNVAFIVMLAGPGLPGEKILLMQSQLIGKANGATDKELKASKKLNKKIYALLKKETDTSLLKHKINNLLYAELKKQKDTVKLSQNKLKMLINKQTDILISPWFRYFLTYNPAETLEKVTCPVLALFGEKDMQVPPVANEKAVKKALNRAGNTDFKTIILPNLNHLFQECKTGSPAEYAKIEQTFSPVALKEISDWILAHIKK